MHPEAKNLGIFNNANRTGTYLNFHFSHLGPLHTSEAGNGSSLANIHCSLLITWQLVYIPLSSLHRALHFKADRILGPCKRGRVAHRSMNFRQPHNCLLFRSFRVPEVRQSKAFLTSQNDLTTNPRQPRPFARPVNPGLVYLNEAYAVLRPSVVLGHRSLVWYIV